MKINSTVRSLFLIFCFFLLHEKLIGQFSLKDYVIMAGPNGTGASIIGSSITINNGSVGAYKLVQTTGNATINSNIFSSDKISITNSNVIKGRIAAGNSSLSSGTVLSVGSSATITGNIDVNGNIVIGGGTVTGTVTLPSGPPTYTYSGPSPSGGVVYGTPSIPTMPTMPGPTVYPAAPVGYIINNYSTTQSLAPGWYGNIVFSGNKTLTLNGPGVYVFNSFQWTGNSNKLVFNFQNAATGNFFIYVIGNADFGKLNASLSNGGSASRIYLETHGDGAGTSIPGNSFIIANGSSGGGSKWQGTVYATNSSINIGSGTGSSSLTGALHSISSVSIQSGVTIEYAAFDPCVPPTVNAGVDRPLEFTGQTTLTATSNTQSASYSWSTINGGTITSNPNAATITVGSAGTYIVTARTAAGSDCLSRDTVNVTAAVRNVIGSELLSIYQNYNPNQPPPPSPFFIIQGGYVKIDVIVFAGNRQRVLDTLTKPTYGLINIYPNGPSVLTITGDFPIVNLLKLNSLGDIINYCRTYYQPYTFKSDYYISGAERDTLTGLVKTAGDTTMRTYVVRPGYNLNGDGIKIGVLSDSYNTITSGSTASSPLQPIKITPYIIDPVSLDTIGTLNPNPQSFNTNTAAQDIANGDLPGDTLGSVNPNGYLKNVHVLQDFPIRRTDEGRAMLQIIHDVAPAAELYFRTGFFTAGDFATGIQQLSNAGCKIITDDITFITEPYLKDGVVSTTVNDVKNNGVSYFTAAGNFANRSYEKNFDPVDATSIGFPGKKAHNFNTGGTPDMFQHVKLKPGNYTFGFQWADNVYSIGETGGTQFDLDIFLTRNTDGTGLIGFNRDNYLGDPFEFIPITISPDFVGDTAAKDYNILIINNTAGGDPARIKYIAFHGDIRITEYNGGTSTIIGQGNAAGAITIGAARFNHVPGHPLLPATLSGITKPQIEKFSSVGGTFVNGTQRLKPDLVGPDGGNTTVKMGQDYPDWALDGYSNFFGTSAAAPHAAGAAALLMQGRKKFLIGHPETSPDELKSLLQLTAVNMRPAGLVGYDFSSGSGLIDADSAMRTFAAPTPFQIQLVVPNNVIPGNNQFLLTVTGENFSTNTVIYINDSAITTTFVDKNTVTALIGAFEGNPEIRAYTPPKTEFGDGGFSNSLYFFDADIVIKAVDTVMKYGQTVPLLDTIITINGKLLKDTTLTLADIGLDHMLLLNSATSTSNVGTYIITPAFDPNFMPSIDLLKKYNYQFINGALTIEKLPLTITAQNKTVTYGDPVPNTQYTYQFNTANIANPTTLLNTITTTHQGQIARDGSGNDIFGLVNGQAVTIVNGQAIPIVNGQAVTIVNGQAVTIVNGQAIPIVNGQALTIVNGVVTDTSGYNLTSSQTQNLNFQVTQNTLQNTRQITNQTGTTNVVDITQESILDFEVNAAQTQMTNAISNVAAKGMVDQNSYLNGQALTIVNGDQSVVIINGQAVTIVNGQAVTIVNGQAVTIVNGQAVTIVNGQAVTIVNGQAIPIVNSDSRSGVILSESEIGQGLSTLKSLSILSGLNAGNQFILPASLANSNFAITYIPGTLTINKRALQVKANDVTRNYGQDNPPLTVTYTGFVRNQNLQTSGVIGSPNVSTTATVVSPPSPPTYPITVTQGSLASTNYSFIFINGTLTIANDTCLLTHGAFKNFGNTTQVPTSLWFNMTTKVSGQLSVNGDSLVFRAGSVTFNFITSNPSVNNLPLPDGKIVADNTVSAPVTNFDFTRNMWITRVPVGFASTSDVFMTGGIINSSNGFIKSGGNTSSVVKGMFYCNKAFSDQWAYAMAAYQIPPASPATYVTYNMIGNAGDVVSINGTYRAGTPVPILSYLVQGASGGGGNNYTGSKSSFDNFTACLITGSSSGSRPITAASLESNDVNVDNGNIHVMPNPASSHITLNFVPKNSGRSKIIISSLDGRRMIQIDNGITEAGKTYTKRIDVGRLANGIYLLEINDGGLITTKKMVIQR